jgi:hypothetical protein
MGEQPDLRLYFDVLEASAAWLLPESACRWARHTGWVQPPPSTAFSLTCPRLPPFTPSGACTSSQHRGRERPHGAQDQPAELRPPDRHMLAPTQREALSGSV